MQVGYEKIMVSTNISLCLRTMGHSYYGLSIGTRTEQGHCGACRRKWRLMDTDLCPCGETQTMSHIVESCPLTKLNGGLSWLHSADENTVSWLTSYGSWNAYEKKKTVKLLANKHIPNCIACNSCSAEWRQQMTLVIVISGMQLSESTPLCQQRSPGSTLFQTVHHRRPSFSGCRLTDLELTTRHSRFGINTAVGSAPIENFLISTILYSLAQ